MESFYTRNELEEIGFKSIGNNVSISRKASIYSPGMMVIGDDVRIDDFCFLSGKIIIENNVHISAYSSLIGGSEGIEMYAFSGVSSHVSVYAASDDYSGNYLTNPTVPEIYKNVIAKKVTFCKHALVGTGSCILPGVTIAEGCAVGAMSLVSKSTEPWGVYVGIPCKRIKERSKEMLRLEAEYLETKISHNEM